MDTMSQPYTKEFRDDVIRVALDRGSKTTIGQIDQHLFADSSLDSFDADATALLLQRVREFLAAV